MLWAFASAVVARSARNVDVFGNGVNHTADEVGFLLVQRLEILHVTGVVVKLLHIAHAAEHRQHIRQRSAVANCPRCRAHVGVHLFHHLLHFGRHICQTAAFHRLHHNHWFAVFFANLVALPALHGAVPVDIVDLKLHIFKFGVCGKHMLQRFAVVVKRESDMLCLTLGFQLLQEFPTVDTVEQFDVILVDGVEPVVVEILQPSSGELNVEHPLQIVVGGDFCCGHLVGHGVAFAWVSLHNRLTHKHLAFASVVHERRVEVSETTRHIFVHHLGGKLVVD